MFGQTFNPSGEVAPKARQSRGRDTIDIASLRRAVASTCVVARRTGSTNAAVRKHLTRLGLLGPRAPWRCPKEYRHA